MDSIARHLPPPPVFAAWPPTRPVRHGLTPKLSQLTGDQVQFSGRTPKDNKITPKRSGSIQRLSSTIKAPLDWVARKNMEAKLKKVPTTVDQATLRHEFGHTLLSDISNISHNGLILTPPEIFGSQLRISEEPQNGEELLRHVVMLMAGHASDKSLPRETGWTDQSWKHYINAQSCHDFADIVDILKEGREKNWIKAPVEALPQLDIERFQALSAKPNEAMSRTENEEYLQFLEQLEAVAQFPLVKDAIETAQRVHQRLSDTQLEAITDSLERQSFFSSSAVKDLLNQHVTPAQKAGLTSELERFVAKHQS